MRTHVPIAVLAGAAVLIAGGALVLHKANDERVNTLVERSTRLRADIAADDQLLTREAALVVRHDQLRNRLRSLMMPADLTVRVASFVRDTSRIATAHRTMVASITPNISVPITPPRIPPATANETGVSPLPPRPSGEATSNGTMAFDLTLDGAYTDVLAAVRAMATLAFPADVSLTALTRKSPNTPDTTVRAGVHVILDAPIASAVSP